jgi:predicted Zn-dependent protease
MTTLSILAPKQEVSLQKILQQLPALGADSRVDFVGLRRVFETTHFRQARDGKPEENHITFDRGIMVEAVVQGQMGYAATADLSLSGVTQAYRKAVELAKAGQGRKIFDFSAEQRPLAKGIYNSPRRIPLSEKSLKEFSDELCAATHHLKVSDKIVSTQAETILVETEIEYATSLGAHTLQDFLLVSAGFAATAYDHHESQTRSLWGPRGYTRQAGLEAFEEYGLKADLIRTGEEAVALLSAPDCPSDKRDLILLPNQMYIQIHESIGHPLEMDRILGDERNFAGWSFVKPENIGTLQYGSRLMNVTFDPSVTGEYASYAFDDGGSPAQREHLIKDGVLVRGLGGLESQSRMKKPGVSNFRSANWRRAPIDRMANINVEPGTSSLAQMIEQTENGVIMEANISWSIDDYRNKFQFGCEIGHVIKDGKIQGLVKNPNYRGSTLEFWHGLKAVGKKDEVKVFGSPYCGKGEPSQIIRVGHSAPPCLFSQVEVFGGGK